MAKTKDTDLNYLTPERVEVIRQAVCENCWWVDLLKNKINGEADEDMRRALGPIIYARMDLLNEIMLSGVGDTGTHTAELAFMLESDHRAARHATS